MAIDWSQYAIKSPLPSTPLEAKGGDSDNPLSAIAFKQAETFDSYKARTNYDNYDTQNQQKLYDGYTNSLTAKLGYPQEAVDAFKTIQPRPLEKGFFDTILSGFKQGKNIAELGSIASTTGNTEGIASQIADYAKVSRQTQDELKFGRDVQAAQTNFNQAEGFADSAKAGLGILGSYLSNPKQLSGEIAKSLGTSYPAIAAAAAGSLVAPVFGTIAGFAAGNLGVNISADTAGNILETLANKGININDNAAVMQALKADPSIVSIAAERGRKSGLATGLAETAADVATLGLASKATRVGRALSNVGTPAKYAAGSVAQGIGEGAGSAAGQYVDTGNVNVGQAISEGVVGSIAGLADVGVLSNAANATPANNSESNLYSGLNDAVNTASEANNGNTTADIGIVNPVQENDNGGTGGGVPTTSQGNADAFTNNANATTASTATNADNATGIVTPIAKPDLTNTESIDLTANQILRHIEMASEADNGTQRQDSTDASGNTGSNIPDVTVRPSDIAKDTGITSTRSADIRGTTPTASDISQPVKTLKSAAPVEVKTTTASSAPPIAINTDVVQPQLEDLASLTIKTDIEPSKVVINAQTSAPVLAESAVSINPLIEKHRATIESFLPAMQWATEGGRIIRNAEGDVTGRTSWEPLDYELDSARGEGVSYTYMKKAVQKALDGKKLSAKQTRAVNSVIDFADEVNSAIVNNEAYTQDAGTAESDINEIAINLHEDEINSMLREASIESREYLNDARVYEDNQDEPAKEPSGAQREVTQAFNEPTTKSTNSPATSSQSQDAGAQETPRLQPKAITTQAVGGTKQNQQVTPIIEAIVKRRKAAQELGSLDAFNDYLAGAKKLMNGESVSASVFKFAAAKFAPKSNLSPSQEKLYKKLSAKTRFKDGEREDLAALQAKRKLVGGDAELSDLFKQLFDIQAPSTNATKAEKANAFDTYKTIIADARSVQELQSIANDIQAETLFSDTQATALDDLVMNKIDALDNTETETDATDNTTTTEAKQATDKTDLLGDNTTGKQAIADAERAKDAKRNAGNNDTEGFNLTGSDSEADKAVAAVAQALFSRQGNRIDLIKNDAIAYAKENFSGKSYVNKSDGKPILVGNQGIKHAMSGKVSEVSAVALTKLDEILTHAKFVRSEPDKLNRPQIIEARFYQLPVELFGKKTTIEVVVRVALDGSRYYDHFEIRNPTATGDLTIVPVSSNGVMSLDDSIIVTQSFSKVNRQQNNPTTPALIRKAIESAFGDVWATVSKHTNIITSTEADKLTGVSSENGNKAQAFYDPATNKMTLIADNIQQGSELSVWLHEVSHKRLEELVGKENLTKLHKAVDSWKSRPVNSNERKVYEAANARATEAAKSADITNLEFSKKALDAYAETADKLLRAFESMGLEGRRHSSMISQSEYVEVESKEYTETDGESGDVYKIRVSDHELPDSYERPNFDVTLTDNDARGDVGGTWVDAVIFISKLTGALPTGVYKTIVNNRRLETAEKEEAHKRTLKSIVERRKQADIENKAYLDKAIAWANSLPSDAVFINSNKGNLSARLSNGDLVLFGKAPFGRPDLNKLRGSSIKFSKTNPQSTKAFNQETYNAEFLAYAIEEASNLGIVPDVSKGLLNVAGWLGKIKDLFSNALAKLIARPKNLSVQDLVTMAYGAAGLEIEGGVVDSKAVDANNNDIRFSRITNIKDLFKRGNAATNSADNVLSDNLEKATGNGNVLQAKDETNWLWAYREAAIDYQTPILRWLDKTYGDAFNHPIWQSLKTIPTKLGALNDRFVREHKQPLENIIKSIADRTGHSYEAIASAVGQYATFMHVEERNALLKAKGLDTKAGGYTNAQAKAGIDYLEKALGKDELAKAQAMIVATNRDLLDKMLDAKQVTGAQAQVYRDMFKHYVPMTIEQENSDPFTELDANDMFTSSINAAVFKKTEGYTVGNADNAYIATLARAARVNGRVASADFKQAMFEAAKDSNGEITVEDLTPQLNSPQLELPLDINGNPILQEDKQGMIYKDADGKAYRIKFSTQSLQDAIYKRNVEEIGGILNIVAVPTRFIARNVTQLIAAFAPINMIRDVGSKFILVRNRVYKDTNGKVVNQKSVGKAMMGYVVNPDVWKSVYQLAFHKSPDNPSPIYTKLRKAIDDGSLSTWGDNFAKSREQAAEDIKSLSNSSTQLAKVSDFISSYSAMFEMVSSSSAYLAMVDHNVEAKAAAFHSLDLMNFKQKGARSAIPRAFYMFSNPTIQSFENIRRSLINTDGSINKAGTKDAVMLFVAANILYAIAKMTGDDDKVLGNEIDRRGSNEIATGLTFKLGKTLFKIPVPFELPQLMWAAAVSMQRAISGRYSAGEAAGEVAKAFAKSTIPIGYSEIPVMRDPLAFVGATITPTVLKPIFNVAMDKNAFGSPLTKPFKKADAFSSEQAKRSTEQAWVDIAKGIRTSTGIDMAPEVVKELWNGYMAGLPAETTKAMFSKSVKQKEDAGEKVTTQDYVNALRPLGISRIILGDDHYIQSRYYDYINHGNDLLKQVNVDVPKEGKAKKGMADSVMMNRINKSSLNEKEKKLAFMTYDALGDLKTNGRGRSKELKSNITLEQRDAINKKYKQGEDKVMLEFLTEAKNNGL